MNKTVKVIGAGLAGCEASLQLANHGFKVELYDIKPTNFTPAHTNQNFCELVCSNSLKNDTLDYATGLLKQELRELNSYVINCADKCKIPAGKTLTVDREKFSQMVTDLIKSNPNIIIINKEVTEITDEPTIIATGPLTTFKLMSGLQSIIGKNFYFYDAIAPIISADSIDMSKVFVANKFDNSNEGDYINCPMSKDEYLHFVDELRNAKRCELHSFENEKVFEGCMPIEIMAKRDIDTMRYGPLNNVGLKFEGKKPYACVQLRKENVVGDAYNMVGFQTNLTFDEQKRIFRTIPGLEKCEFLRYGVMHRNSYINAPKLLNHYFQLKSNPNIFFAGQFCGVEGYVESIASGLLCGINMIYYLLDKSFIEFGTNTAVGALANYMECANENNFQPMHINWSLFTPITASKEKKKQMLVDRALNDIKRIKETLLWKN